MTIEMSDENAYYRNCIRTKLIMDFWYLIEIFLTFKKATLLMSLIIVQSLFLNNVVQDEKFSEINKCKDGKWSKISVQVSLENHLYVALSYLTHIFQGNRFDFKRSTSVW